MSRRLGGSPVEGQGKPGPKRRAWVKRLAAVVVPVFFLLSAASPALASSPSADTSESTGEQIKEQLYVYAVSNKKIRAINTGSVKVKITAVVRKQGSSDYVYKKVSEDGDKPYISPDDVVFPNERATITLQKAINQGQANEIAVLTDRGVLYRVEATVISGNTTPGAPVTATVASEPKTFSTRAGCESGRFQIIVPFRKLGPGPHHFKVVAGDMNHNGVLDENEGAEGYTAKVWPPDAENATTAEEIAENGSKLEQGKVNSTGNLTLHFKPIRLDLTVENAEPGYKSWKYYTHQFDDDEYKVEEKIKHKFSRWKKPGRIVAKVRKQHGFTGKVLFAPSGDELEFEFEKEIEFDDGESSEKVIIKTKLEGVSEDRESFEETKTVNLQIEAQATSPFGCPRKEEKVKPRDKGITFSWDDWQDLKDEWTEEFDISQLQSQMKKLGWAESTSTKVNVSIVGSDGNEKYKFRKRKFYSYKNLESGLEPITETVEISEKNFDDKVRVEVSADPGLSPSLSPSGTLDLSESRTLDLTIRPDLTASEREDLKDGERITKTVTVHAWDPDPPENVSKNIDIKKSFDVTFEAKDKPSKDPELLKHWKEWFTLGSGGHRFKGEWNKDVTGHRTKIDKTSGKYHKKKYELYSYSLGKWQTASIPIFVEGHNFDGEVKLSVDPDSGLNVSLSDSTLDVHSEASTTMDVTPTVRPDKGTTLMKNVEVYAKDANPPGGVEAIDREKLANITIVVPSKGPDEGLVDRWQEWFDLSVEGGKFEATWRKSKNGEYVETNLAGSQKKYLKKKYVMYKYGLEGMDSKDFKITVDGRNFEGDVRLSVQADPGLSASLEDSTVTTYSPVSTKLIVKPTVKADKSKTLMKDVTVYAWDANPPEGVDAIRKHKVAEYTIIIPKKGSEKELAEQWKEWFELSAPDKIRTWNKWVTDSYSTDWRTVKTEEKTQSKKFTLKNHNNKWLDALTAANEWAKEGQSKVTTKIKITGYVKQAFPPSDYKGEIEGLPRYIKLPPKQYEPKIKEIRREGKVVKWLEEKSEKYETEGAALDKYRELIGANLDALDTWEDPVYKNIRMENKTDYNEPIEWGAKWWEKKWHFKNYSDKSKAENKLEAVKKSKSYTTRYGQFGTDYYGEKMYPDKYKAKWYTLNRHSKTYDTKKQAKDEKDAYWSWETDSGLTPESVVPRYNEDIEKIVGNREYKAEWTTWVNRSTTRYEDLSGARDRKGRLEDRSDVRDASLVYVWDEHEKWVTETKSSWFDDRNDHRGDVVDKKCARHRTYCADRDYKIKWYDSTHHKEWRGGWDTYYTRKRVRHTYHYWTRKKVCNWHWKRVRHTGHYYTHRRVCHRSCSWHYSWWRGWYRSCHRSCHWKRVRHTYHYYTRKRVRSCHWKRVRHTGHYYTTKRVKHRRWNPHDHKVWVGGYRSRWFDDRNDHRGDVVGKKCSNHNTYCADQDYKIQWTEGHWEGGYDYKVKYEEKEHGSDWFDSRADAKLAGEVVDSRVSDYDYKYKWDTRSYSSDTFISKSDAKDAATKGSRHEVHVKPIHWQVEYYEKDWKNKTGFDSESAAKDAYQNNILRHGGYTYATDWGVDWVVSWDTPHEKKYVDSDKAWDKYLDLDGKAGVRDLDIVDKKVFLGYRAERYGVIETQKKSTHTYSWKKPWYKRSTPKAFLNAEGQGTNGHAFSGDVEIEVVDSSDSNLRSWVSDGKIGATGYDYSTLRFDGKTTSYGRYVYEIGPREGTQWVKIKAKDANGPLSFTKKVKLDIGTRGHDKSSTETRTRYDYDTVGAPPFTADLTKNAVEYGASYKLFGLIPSDPELKENPPKIVIERGEPGTKGYVKKKIWAITGLKAADLWAKLLPRTGVAYKVVLKLKSMQTGRTVKLSFYLNPEDGHVVAGPL